PTHWGRPRGAAALGARPVRRGAPVAGVVFAADLRRRQPDHVPAGVRDAAITAVAQGQKQAGRASDAIGRLGPKEFAVLAPDTDPGGALRLGTRLRGAIESSGAARAIVHGLKVRAGYHGVDDFHAAGLDPLDLLAHATSALRAAEAGGTGLWIRPFRSGLRVV